MPAMHAYPWLRQRALDGVDEDTRIEIDALLGDPEAQSERLQRREAAWDAIGGDVG